MYNFSDITGGLYLLLYGAADQPAEVEDACGDLSINGQPDTIFGGDTFDGTGTITDIDNFTLSFANGWGDQGDVVYTRQ